MYPVRKVKKDKATIKTIRNHKKETRAIITGPDDV